MPPGYTVQVSSAVLHKGDLTIISGAPRYQHTGAVYLMNNHFGSNLEKSLMLVGEQVGSYFGSAIALADLDNNG